MGGGGGTIAEKGTGTRPESVSLGAVLAPTGGACQIIGCRGDSGALPLAYGVTGGVPGVGILFAEGAGATFLRRLSRSVTASAAMSNVPAPSPIGRRGLIWPEPGVLAALVEGVVPLLVGVGP